MYAIIKTGGKQFRVSEGDILEVEKLDVEPGEIIEIKDVLAINDDTDFHVGMPRLDDSVVKAEILEQGFDEPVIVFKYKPKKGYRKHQIHKQPHTKIKINEIILNDTDKDL